MNFERAFDKGGRQKSWLFAKLQAFTLAEILIVLSIIGIVAALTIPTLVNKVQNQEYVTELKKAYSQLTNGFGQLLADEGVTQLEDTSTFSEITSWCYINPTGDPFCNNFYPKIEKYIKFNMIKAPSDYQIYELNGQSPTNYSNKNVLSLPDGSIIPMAQFYKKSQAGDTVANIQAKGGHMFGKQGSMYIDVNGFKKPNRIGRDVFIFYIASDGKIYPLGCKDIDNFWYGTYWKDSPSGCSITGGGDFCGGKILEEGWQMNY